MASYNRIILMGNLTRDPEYRQLPSGQGVCRLSLATNRQFKNKQSDTLVQEVCYIDIDVWGAQAESCRQYLQKGRPILVEGRLKYDTWQDQSGQNRSKHSIVADRVTFLGTQGAAEVDEAGKENAEPEPAAATENNFQLNPNNPVERDLMQQLEKAKAKIQGAKKEAPDKESKPAPQSAPSSASSYANPPSLSHLRSASSGGQAELRRTGAAVDKQKQEDKPTPQPSGFVDQPPFKDDLPF
jgi:single-strand DNA-binding protein